MRDRRQLTPGNPTASVALSFDAVAIMVSNPTGSPIYLRIGGQDIPVAANADLVVPAATVTTYGVVGRWFGLSIASPALVTTGNSAISGLERTATVVFLGPGEVIPQLGSISYQSLSLSDLTSGPVAFSGLTTTAAYDLGAWGGAILYVLPTSVSGQGVLSVQASSDQVTWVNVLRVAFWPDVPLTISVPRTQRYVRLVFNLTAIPGEPAIAGSYSMRASLQEITEVAWAAGNGQISKAYNVPSLSSTTYYFATTGLKSVSVRLANSTGTRAQMVWYTSNVVGNWSLVAYREQSVSGFYNSVFRSLGNLDSFLRIDVVEIANAGPLTGTLNLSVQADPDTTGMLQNIFAALGDIGQPVNTNQSIFHVLDTMRLQDATRNTLISTTNSLLTTGNTNTGQIVTNIRSYSNMLRAVFTIAGAGAYGIYGGGNIFGAYANGYLVRALVAFKITGAAVAGGAIRLTFGNAGAPSLDFYAIIPNTTTGTGPVMDYDGTILGGFNIGGFTHLWAYANSANVGLEVTLIVRPP